MNSVRRTRLPVAAWPCPSASRSPGYPPAHSRRRRCVLSCVPGPPPEAAAHLRPFHSTLCLLDTAWPRTSSSVVLRCSTSNCVSTSRCSDGRSFGSAWIKPTSLPSKATLLPVTTPGSCCAALLDCVGAAPTVCRFKAHKIVRHSPTLVHGS